MTLRGLDKVFATLRHVEPKALKGLSPHTLRHTWNDNFSALMEQQQISEAEEKKLRSYLMGWKESSSTSQQYTKRYTERKARSVALDLQNDQFGRAGIKGGKKWER